MHYDALRRSFFKYFCLGDEKGRWPWQRRDWGHILSQLVAGPKRTCALWCCHTTSNAAAVFRSNLSEGIFFRKTVVRMPFWHDFCGFSGAIPGCFFGGAWRLSCSIRFQHLWSSYTDSYQNQSWVSFWIEAESCIYIWRFVKKYWALDM